MEEEILPILKYSYDSLNGEQVRSCFLLLSLAPEDYWMIKEIVIELWIGEGFIDEKEGRERAFNQGYEILGTLVRSCLLLEDEVDKTWVKMHDVIREMAIWISSDLGKHKEKYIIQTGVGLREIPKVKNWKNVRRMSLMENEIEKISESLDCPELTMLLLRRNKLVTISSEFFRSMPRLLVLDLSWNSSLSGLPEQISRLVFLRYLNLLGTKIERLPVGLLQLKMLIYLNLESTYELESVKGISNLSSLRTLKLYGSKVWLDMSLMKELQLLEHLEYISITIPSNLVGGQLLFDPRVGRYILRISIRERPEESVRVLDLPATGNLYNITVQNCGMKEIKIGKTPWNKNLTGPCFSNLSTVIVVECHVIKDLTWLLFAPNLINLRVGNLKQLEEIISKEKAASVLEEACIILPFEKLEFLILYELPELKSIYWNAVPFQRLRFLSCDCSQLRKLPLDSKSVFKVEEFVLEYKEEEWIERVEWEDEATRHRFLPFCKQF